MASNVREEAIAAAQIVADAGGEIIGRTKLQKIAYLLEVMHLGSGFPFEYKHYGPYSESLSSAVKVAEVFDFIGEDIRTATWGGFYSIFRTKQFEPSQSDETRKSIVALGNASDAVELELAATAVLLALEGYRDPWAETANRKPDKATDARLSKSIDLFKRFKELDKGGRLPAIA